MKYETSTCYHCDAVATGREHVPPRSFCPAGKDWNRLMTVPSCRLHNNATSPADDYLKFVLGAISPNVPAAIRSDVARGAVRMVQRKIWAVQMRSAGTRWRKGQVPEGARDR